MSLPFNRFYAEDNFLTDHNTQPNRISRLALGTAQFGSDYGISNPGGQTKLGEVRLLLQHAADAGLSLIDTAAAYGESEKVLGETIPDGDSFQIVTKILPLISDNITNSDITLVRDRFMRSLELLKVTSVYGLMVHHAENLLVPNGECLAELLYSLRLEGLVSRIGVSVYSPQSAIELTGRFGLDLVQAPVNIFDQRFVKSGCFEELQAAGVEIHARSIFLQGLLLMEPLDIPKHLSPLAEKLRLFKESASLNGITPLEAAISYVFGIEEVSRVVVGICDVKQLDEIISVVKGGGSSGCDYANLAISDEKLVNPSLWDSLPKI